MKICVDGPTYVGEYFVQTHYKTRLINASADVSTTIHLIDRPGAANTRPIYYAKPARRLGAVSSIRGEARRRTCLLARPCEQ